MAKAVDDFADWLQDRFAERGSFTMLIVLVRIGRLAVDPVSSSWLHVIGDEVDWPAMKRLLARSPAAWDGAAFFVGTNAEGGPLPDALARARLRDLERDVRADRLHLNLGGFFDREGRLLQIEERQPDA